MKSKFNGWLAAVLAALVFLFATPAFADIDLTSAKATTTYQMPATVPDGFTPQGIDAADEVAVNDAENPSPYLAIAGTDVMAVNKMVEDMESRSTGHPTWQPNSTEVMAAGQAFHSTAPGWSRSQLSG